METTVLDRSSKEARELARTPVGRTWINYDALTEAKRRLGDILWVRRNMTGRAARGVFGVLEPQVWNFYVEGTTRPSQIILAFTVEEVEDLGRDAWVEARGRHFTLDRYIISGIIYRLRDDDLVRDNYTTRSEPAEVVPFEDVLRLPNLVYVSGLQGKPVEVAS